MTALVNHASLDPAFRMSSSARLVAGMGGHLVVENAFSIDGRFYDVEVAKDGVLLTLDSLNESFLIQKVQALYSSVIQSTQLHSFSELKLTHDAMTLTNEHGAQRVNSRTVKLDAEKFVAEAGDAPSFYDTYPRDKFDLANAVDYVASYVLSPNHLGMRVHSGFGLSSMNARPHGPVDPAMSSRAQSDGETPPAPKKANPIPLVEEPQDEVDPSTDPMNPPRKHPTLDSDLPPSKADAATSTEAIAAASLTVPKDDMSEGLAPASNGYYDTVDGLQKAIAVARAATAALRDKSAQI